MQTETFTIDGIPAILWGRPSDKLYVHVHGKLSRKEYAAEFARIAEEKGYQTLSFDLPAHGARKNSAGHCDIRSGIHDVTAICRYACSRWKAVSVFACSLGAYFCLHSLGGLDIRNCLFQSPIVDMAYLIRQMMCQFGISREALRTQGQIDTPAERLSWEEYQYVLQHPVTDWKIPTQILYAGKDDMQPRGVMEAFASAFGCGLTVSENSAHPFLAETDGAIVTRWLQSHIETAIGGKPMNNQHLELVPADVSLAQALADYYVRNRDFLAEFEPERSEAFFTAEYQRRVLEREVLDREAGTSCRFYIRPADRPREIIGVIGLNNIIYGAFRSAFLGYKLDARYLGRGYMSAAVAMVADYGFNVLHLHRIEANVMPRNKASLRVLEKNGFQNEGFSPKYLKINGVWEDHIHMVKLGPA